MATVPERSELDDADTWNLESIYASDEDWEAAFEDARDAVAELDEYDETDVTDATALLDLLELRDDTMRTVSQVVTYARLRSDEDTRDQEYQAMQGRAQTLSAEARSAASFLEPAIQQWNRDDLEDLIADEPGLEPYEFHLEDVLRMKPHTRSPEVEELLADLSEVTGAPGDIYQLLANADMEFPTVEDPDGEAVEISQANLTNLLKRPDREFRQTVHESFYEEWGTVRNTVGASYENSVTADVRLAEARNYDTAREAALDGSNVPVSVYDALVETVEDNLDVLHRHAELKREALGVDDLQMWDIYAPMTGDDEPEVTWEEATDHVLAAIEPLGEAYQDRVAAGLEGGWVDVYENKGKRSGAYSAGTYDTQPFVLMNYQDDVSSMFTLAHELGHSMHSELTNDAQPYVYSDYEIFVAEVASTVNETLLTRHLLDTVEDEAFRARVLEEYLERFRSTLFRQTMFAHFEHETHRLVEEGESLTPDRLDELYGDLKADYYEPTVIDDHITREWMRIPHFYWAFYVYQYATGISSAVAIAREIAADFDAETSTPGDATEDYLEFLSRGGRGSPPELLEIVGVDVESGKAVEAAIAEYDERLDDVAETL
ncbi:oligoendopeptidase F [Salinarchaeum sp. Harcht-Bsk1]|uniref:oligoendopeptidase F n=1 Tax=Salinarchaeum sp. Harcht-Bsk1 TaxID=1333523 RepID=UPI0003423026|nr:oligoendopeptidase F [Salinarchaeum sp. Harcht-Bsk1]AGN02102.1 oligoendopeptidase F [Salinarchaeum sp. Harcht-Bsk1]